MYIQISQNLNEWKNREHRKPLLLLGVRQPGKTIRLKNLDKNSLRILVI